MPSWRSHAEKAEQQEAGENMIQLYEHNQTAYESVLALLPQSGKAAVIHPTGTGKSFIAFKLVEDHPEKTFVWLSPSEKIYDTQLENVKKASGFSPNNIAFFTYSKLTNMTDDVMMSLRPDYIILDEFHRAGAPEWGKSVQTLISHYPEANLLGLSATNIRYLDDQRDMAYELFENYIADSMSLAEAVTRGILPAPKYVVSIYSFKLEEEYYKSRMNRISRPARIKAEEYLNKLRYAIEQAEGLEEIFPKHMENPHGKYIVFCTNYNHLQEMMQKSQTWFQKVDQNPHFYSVWADSPSADRDYKAFREDDSDHLRLLFCIDMFNEGIHVEDISGVILFRPTVSPIIYKQQIGRALSALRSDANPPVIFDIVNNFENLQTISSVEEEIYRIANFETEARDTSTETVNPFQIIDEIKECRELFRKLEETLSLSWDMMYQEAKAFHTRHGHLNIPKRYKTPNGYPLGVWLQTQRRVKRGLVYGLLTEERIRLLNEIGMNWATRSETAWEVGIQHAKEYKQQFGDLDVVVQYVSPDGFCLGRWIANYRHKYVTIRDSGKDPFVIHEFQTLDKLGMIWDKRNEQFQRGLKAASDYVDRNGNLNVSPNYSTEDGFKLGQWLNNQRTRRKRNNISQKAEKELSQLDPLGMRWSHKADYLWEEHYQQAKHYFETNHHLNPTYNFCDNGFYLGRWIMHQREYYIAGKLNSDQVNRLERIGMEWISPNSWESYYQIAKRYYQKYGDLEPKPDYVSPEGVWLGRWLATQRLSKKNGTITSERIQLLSALQMRWIDKNDEHWDKMLFDLIKWVSEHKNSIHMSPDTKAEDGTNLYTWTRRQLKKSINNELDPQQKLKWGLFLYNLYNYRIGGTIIER